jgi:hypothetical protein
MASFDLELPPAGQDAPVDAREVTLSLQASGAPRSSSDKPLSFGQALVQQWAQVQQAQLVRPGPPTAAQIEQEASKDQSASSAL